MQDFTKRASQSFAQPQSKSIDQGLRSYMQKVYNYMAGGLTATGVLAYITASTPALLQATVQLNLILFLGLLGMVFYLSFRIQKMSYSSAQFWFWAYAGLNGVVLAPLFLVYTGASIAKVFFITASVFGAMSIYGYTTKKDLTNMGGLLIMGLFGIIIASIVNLFLQSPGLEFAVSIIGVLIFVGLTAYDTQKIKATYYQVGGTGETAGKAAIMGALALYLDFINLLLMLLRLIGERR